MKLLKEIQFKGWINLELDATQKSAMESAQITVEYVNTKLTPIYT